MAAGSGRMMPLADVRGKLLADLTVRELDWAGMQEALSQLVAHVTRDPRLLTPALQRELVKPLLDCCTNERSALAARACAAIHDLVALCGGHARDLVDRTLYAVLKHTGSGNKLNAQRALALALALVRICPSPLLVSETQRARCDFAANTAVQESCYRVTNSVIATWPDAVMARVAVDPTSDLAKLLLAGVHAGAETARRISRINYRLYAARFPSAAAALEARNRGKLPGWWPSLYDADRITDDAARVAGYGEGGIAVALAADVGAGSALAAGVGAGGAGGTSGTSAGADAAAYGASSSASHVAAGSPSAALPAATAMGSPSAAMPMRASSPVRVAFAPAPRAASPPRPDRAASAAAHSPSLRGAGQPQRSVSPRGGAAAPLAGASAVSGRAASAVASTRGSPSYGALPVQPPRLAHLPHGVMVAAPAIPGGRSTSPARAGTAPQTASTHRLLAAAAGAPASASTSSMSRPSSPPRVATVRTPPPPPAVIGGATDSAGGTATAVAHGVGTAMPSAAATSSASAAATRPSAPLRQAVRFGGVGEEQRGAAAVPPPAATHFTIAPGTPLGAVAYDVHARLRLHVNAAVQAYSAMLRAPLCLALGDAIVEATRVASSEAAAAVAAGAPMSALVGAGTDDMASKPWAAAVPNHVTFTREQLRVLSGELEDQVVAMRAQLDELSGRLRAAREFAATAGAPAGAAGSDSSDSAGGSGDSGDRGFGGSVTAAPVAEPATGPGTALDGPTTPPLAFPVSAAAPAADSGREVAAGDAGASSSDGGTAAAAPVEVPAQAPATGAAADVGDAAMPQGDGGEGDGGGASSRMRTRATAGGGRGTRRG